MVDVREEDKTIREFKISPQEFAFDFSGKILDISEIGIVKNGEPVSKKFTLTMRKGSHVLVAGPNGIGKSTLLRRIVARTARGITIGENVRLGYYSQDFGTLDPEEKAYDYLYKVMEKPDEQKLRSTAAGFLLDGKALGNKIGGLSEGQKGLLVFTSLVLMRPGLLILDEPTNHINFRHLPVIAKALNDFEGALLMVSHIPDFVSQIRIDATIDLAKL
jgi:ATPase subunit of ABC transporter with duplicated ATPase domains